MLVIYNSFPQMWGSLFQQTFLICSVQTHSTLFLERTVRLNGLGLFLDSHSLHFSHTSVILSLITEGQPRPSPAALVYSGIIIDV